MTITIISNADPADNNGIILEAFPKATMFRTNFRQAHGLILLVSIIRKPLFFRNFFFRPLSLMDFLNYRCYRTLYTWFRVVDLFCMV